MLIVTAQPNRLLGADISPTHSSLSLPGTEQPSSPTVSHLPMALFTSIAQTPCQWGGIELGGRPAPDDQRRRGNHVGLFARVHKNYRNRRPRSLPSRLLESLGLVLHLRRSSPLSRGGASEQPGRPGRDIHRGLPGASAGSRLLSGTTRTGTRGAGPPSPVLGRLGCTLPGGAGAATPRDGGTPKASRLEHQKLGNQVAHLNVRRGVGTGQEAHLSRGHKGPEPALVRTPLPGP